MSHPSVWGELMRSASRSFLDLHFEKSEEMWGRALLREQTSQEESHCLHRIEVEFPSDSQLSPADALASSGNRELVQIQLHLLVARQRPTKVRPQSA